MQPKLPNASCSGVVSFGACHVEKLKGSVSIEGSLVVPVLDNISNEFEMYGPLHYQGNFVTWTTIVLNSVA